MTHWTRTINRIRTNQLPAWVNNIQQANTLYYVTSHASVVDLPPKYAGIWPGGSKPTMFGQGDEEYRTHAIYSGAIHVEDQSGAFGTLVYPATGEFTFSNNMNCLKISQDIPTWDIWYPPTYATTLAEAQANNADYYYNPAEAAQRLIDYPLQTTNAIAAGTWNGQFPIVYSWPNTPPQPQTTGWIMWCKSRQSLYQWASFSMRYDHPVFIPSSMTGTGSGAIICDPDSFAGPYQGGAGKPSAYVGPGKTYPASMYVDEVWPDGGDKLYLQAQSTSTKQWQRLLNAPNHAFLAPAPNDYGPHVLVNRSQKRTYSFKDEYWWYHDYTNGLAGVTRSNYTKLTYPNGGGPFGYNYDAGCCPLEGHPQGRNLIYILQAPGTQPDIPSASTLLLVDFENGTMYSLPLAPRGLSIQYRNPVRFGYSPNFGSYGRVFMVWIEYGDATNTVRFARFDVPADPTNPANYTVTQVNLALAPGVTVEPSFKPGFSRQGKYFDNLGVIIFQQNAQPPLAFKPAA